MVMKKALGIVAVAIVWAIAFAGVMIAYSERVSEP